MSPVNSEVDGMFTRCRGIIAAVNEHTDVVICHSVSECQCEKNEGGMQFCHKIGCHMAAYLEISVKEIQIDHLHQKRFHGEDCKNRSGRSWDYCSMRNH